MEELVKYSEDGHVAILHMNRPKKFNSFIRDMAIDLQSKLRLVSQDDNIRAILLTGEGKAFSAGQDLNEVTDPENQIELQRIVAEHFNPIIQLIRETPKPIIAAVNGVAAGAGANIAIACDIVLATESASFIQAFSKIGLIPDSGGTYTLPRLIGFQKASALMMLGEKVSATDAESMGMIYKVIPDDEFQNESTKLAQKLSKMPTIGLGLTKMALNASQNNNLNEQLALEEQLQTKAALTDDYEEGVAAFLEKRKPKFTGK